MRNPLYTTYDSVKVRLTGKIQFQSGDSLIEGEFPDALLKQIVADAETDIEQELRSRYMVPFQSIRYGNYEQLPDHTKRAIRKVVDSKAVMKILDTDFGRGTHVNAEEYYKNLKSTYDTDIMRLLGRDAIAMNDKIDRFKFSPPLDDLKLANCNAMADDGYRGRIINTDGSQNDSATYAEDQINDPSRSYVTSRGFKPL